MLTKEIDQNRDQKWLEQIFNTIINDHFHDVKTHNPIRIEWGKRARTRLGSLSYDPQKKQAVVRITRLFTDPEVPALVVKATIVHELSHYSHGWHNGGQPKYRHPHRGGVIKEEFAERGLEELYLAQQGWLKANWIRIVKKHYPNIRYI